MNFQEERILRCASRLRQKLGQMSDAAYEELVLAVRQNPDAYIDSDAERAFALLAQAIRKFNESARDDDLLDGEQYMAARNKRFEALRGACQAALSMDAGCLDAQLLLTLATVGRPDKLLGALCELEEKCSDKCAFALLDWRNPWDRARFRLRAAISRTCADGACWKMALETARSVPFVPTAPPAHHRAGGPWLAAS